MAGDFESLADDTKNVAPAMEVRVSQGIHRKSKSGSRRKTEAQKLRDEMDDIYKNPPE